jgi:hypothetical protein
VQIAALWTLRNFGLAELYRGRMATMGVMPLCVGILEDTHQPVSVHHAAAAVLQVCAGDWNVVGEGARSQHRQISVQVATTADEDNVKKLSETNALPRLIACLYVKHRCVHAACPGRQVNICCQMTQKNCNAGL